MNKKRKKYSGTMLGFFAEAGATELDETMLRAAELAEEAKHEPPPPEPTLWERCRKWFYAAMPFVGIGLWKLFDEYMRSLF